MAELLFIATTIFVAYVLFEVVGSSKRESSSPGQPVTKPDSSPTPVASPEKVMPAAAMAKPVSKKEPASKPSAAVETKVAKTSSSKPKKAPAKKEVAVTVPVDSLKNPKTGEVAKVPANYAFAKRWIKDALVEEGLLDKVYKNNELDPDTTAKIHAALDQLKTMEKYQ